MNIQEIINQREQSFNAKKEVEKTEHQKKVEILLPFAMKFFDFLEVIQKDPDFKFSSLTSPRKDDFKPLFGSEKEFVSQKNLVKKEIEEYAFSRMLLVVYGDVSKYFTFGITDDFRPCVAFSSEVKYKESEQFFSLEDAIERLTDFFIEKRQKYIIFKENSNQQ